MKRHRGWARLSSLQVKFTLTYTLVTLVVLMGLFMVLVVLTNQVNTSTPVFATMAASGLLDMGAEVAPALQAVPPDQAALQDWLRRLHSGPAVSMVRHGPEGGIEAFFSSVAAEGTRVLVLDARGQVVAASAAAEAPLSDAARELIAAALDGEDHSERLYRRAAGDRLLAAAPVRAEGGAVVGAALLELVLPNQGQLLRIALASTLPSTCIFGVLAGMIGLVVGALTARGLARRVRAMAATTAAWGRGDFSRKLYDRSPDEVGQLAGDLNRMAGEVQTLLHTRQELAALEERNRLARDLHDSVKQQVFAVTMNLGAAKTLWETQPRAAQQQVEAALDVARQAQRDLTDLLNALRPETLTGRGLPDALRDWAGAWEKQTGIAAQCRLADDGPLPETIEQALFPVAREALVNVARHSGATAASLTLAVHQEQVVLQVRDNGHGFDVGRPGAGLGLRSMLERVQAVGGQLTVESNPRGTLVTARVPLPLEAISC
jgi:signal transduction histidine kinase